MPNAPLACTDRAADPSISVTALAGASEGPRIIELTSHELDGLAWLEENRNLVEQELARHRAVLLRGFSFDTVARFQRAVGYLSSALLDYSERSTPRTTIEAKIFTSTEYPETHEIPMHNENSYSVKWPRRIFFGCLEPAATGGATPIADSRRVFEAIDPAVRERLIAKRVMYVRNYGQGVDLPWEEAFQTKDRASVEAYCRSASIDFAWFENGRGLHTEQVRPAALVDETTGDRVWFNQAHLFHVSSLDPALRRSLTAIFPPDRLPRTACYGDGTAIEDEALHVIREAYRQVRVVFAWRKGDLLFLDNLHYAHGRLPYSGRRKVVVSMDRIGGEGTRPL